MELNQQCLKTLKNLIYWPNNLLFTDLFTNNIDHKKFIFWMFEYLKAGFGIFFAILR